MKQERERNGSEQLSKQKAGEILSSNVSSYKYEAYWRGGWSM